MKKLMNILMRVIAVFVILFIMLGVLANYQKGRFDEMNQPAWDSFDASSATGELIIDKDKGLSLQFKNKDLVLVRKKPLKPQVLFSDYKKNFYHLKMYVKDLRLDGKKEIIFQADRKMYEREMYIFSEMDKKKIKKFNGKGEFWNLGNLKFTEKNKIYIRSCGSQYCDDTYYIWNGIKLNKEYTDSYESM